MNRKLVVAATIVLVAAGGVVVFGFRRHRAPPPKPASSVESPHAQGMDHALSAGLVMYRAPEGSTPCESAYNAFKASEDYANENKVTPVVLWLDSRDDFLAKCGALPGPAQPCLVPLYLARHRPQCDKVRPSFEVLGSMVKIKSVSESDRGPPGEGEPPPINAP